MLSMLIIRSFSQKLKAEADAEALREQIRRLEQEVAKWQNEAKRLEGKEEQARAALLDTTNRAQHLQKLLDNANEEIKELHGISDGWHIRPMTTFRKTGATREGVQGQAAAGIYAQPQLEIHRHYHGRRW